MDPKLLALALILQDKARKMTQNDDIPMRFAAADLVQRSYCDGFDAACDIAASVQLKESSGIDADAIRLGIRTVASILSEQSQKIRKDTLKEPKA